MSIVVPQASSAQTFRQPDTNYQGILLQASGMLVIPFGSEFDSPSVDVGPGVEAAVRWVFPNTISVGGGIRFSTHNFEGFSQNVDFFSIFGQIGYTFIFESSSVRPTLGGRIGWTTQKLPSQFSQNRTGLDVGAFGGVEVPLSDHFALGGQLTFDFLVLSDLSPIDPSDGTAQLFGILATVVILP